MKDNRYNLKGRGYQTRGMHQLENGVWIVPMYRNRDDAMCGSYEVPGHLTKWRAFEVARQDCWNEFSRS